MPRFVDLSVPIENGVASDPEYSRPEITYLGHDQTIDRMRASFPDLTPDHLPDGAAWAIEKLTVTTHHGTHLDAPWHFHPTTNHALGPGELHAWRRCVGRHDQERWHHTSGGQDGHPRRRPP